MPPSILKKKVQAMPTTQAQKAANNKTVYIKTPFFQKCKDENGHDIIDPSTGEAKVIPVVTPMRQGAAVALIKKSKGGVIVDDEGNIKGAKTYQLATAEEVKAHDIENAMYQKRRTAEMNAAKVKNAKAFTILNTSDFQKAAGVTPVAATPVIAPTQVGAEASEVIPPKPAAKKAKE